MEVFYTPEIFSQQRIGGISRYFVELARHLDAAGHKPTLVAGLHRNEHLRLLGRLTMGVYAPFRVGPLHHARVWCNRALCRLALSRHPRAPVHHTYYGDTAYLGSHPLVVTVHDLIHAIFGETFPHLRGESDRTVADQRASCERADHIIAISNTTKNDLVRLFGINPAKITVVHHGNPLLHVAGEIAEPSQVVSPASGGRDAYLLFVGGRADYKNFDALLEAFGRSGSLCRRFRLVCFGGGAWTEGEQRRIATLGLSGRVLLWSGDDAALGRAYRGATAFVLPSLYEGFGLPLLEAMCQDCPVLCARAGSLPEIAGDAAAYFDPESTESIQATLETACADDARLASLRLLGRERLPLFSWERCARETAEVYRRITP
jgi:glycosyltransferase involved in cell wall biosynthesis